MRLGIIGLPLSGKTTVFNALTRSDVPPTTATTGKLETHTAIVDVPDERVDRLSALFKPRKTIYAKVTYTDFANLEQDVGKTGLTGPLRNQIATTDAFVLVIRGFESSVSPHPLGSINPQRDLDLLHNDFMLADLVTVENRLARIDEMLHKGARSEERTRYQEERLLFERLHAGLEAGQPLRDLALTPAEVDSLAGFGLL
ncbi:MAG TPA: redox-regulated ATPase YchF, partial [Anaerolineae bacterium]|nr:redox-regulated ATPase YchF [Anaerolineae bacterium]